MRYFNHGNAPPAVINRSPKPTNQQTLFAIAQQLLCPIGEATIG